MKEYCCVIRCIIMWLLGFSVVLRLFLMNLLCRCMVLMLMVLMCDGGMVV